MHPSAAVLEDGCCKAFYGAMGGSFRHAAIFCVEALSDTNRTLRDLVLRPTVAG